MDAIAWTAEQAVRKTQAEETLARLMDAYERPLFNFLFTLTRDADTASDCVQETFIRAYELLLQGRSCNAAWLYKVARSQAMREFRRLRRLASDCNVDHPSSELQFDERLAVRDVLGRLAESDRELLYLYDVAGWTTEEIAEILGARSDAVRQRLSRARGRFRKLYEQSQVGIPVS